MQTKKLLKQLRTADFNTNRTKEIFNYNPASTQNRHDVGNSKLYVYNYDADSVEHCKLKSVDEVVPYNANGKVTWINMDGLAKSEVESICTNFHIHPLLVEDILSIGQRPKVDEIEGVLFCLLNMLYWNEQKCAVEQEQVSIVLGKNFVITFQEDAERDVFNQIRGKLQLANGKLRLRGADYLCYSLIDIIVDHYFVVIEKLAEKIEGLEEEIIYSSTKKTLEKLNALKKELILLRRNVTPVRDLLNSLIRSESDLLGDQVYKYFKDVLDHIIQAHDVVENCRDIMNSLQDLYISQVNLKMNETMKVMAIVTCLLAPATVIGGIFGMNFEIIPIAHHQYGFYIAMTIMIVIPIFMLFIFRKRGWF